MRRTILAALAVAAWTHAAATAATEAERMSGAWTVDLAAEPGKPYTQPMQLTLKPDGTVEGSFYNSPIQAGRWKTDRGRTCVSFRTTDGAGPYHTAACLAGEQVQGQTWAEHRNFLFNWNAARQ
jgi:hypothetical protein